MSDDETGTCDTCEQPYLLGSREGRCGDCGDCGDCCTHVRREATR